MKRIYFTVLLSILFILPTMAQHRGGGSRPTPPSRNHSPYSSSNISRWTNYGRETYFGLRLGVAVASVNSDDKYLDGGNAKAGLNVGFIAGTQLTPYVPIFIESGLQFTQKGGKGDIEGKKFTYGLKYLELPIIIKYKYFLDYSDIAIQPFFGGFLSCGVGGKIKNFGDREIQESFSKENFKRFDGGLRLGCGVSFQNLYLDLGYDIGLANICHDSFDTSRTGCFYATIGIDF